MKQSIDFSSSKAQTSTPQIRLMEDQSIENRTSISSPASMRTSIPIQLLRGSIAGSIAKTLVYPFDRLKMIYQVRFHITYLSICLFSEIYHL